MENVPDVMNFGGLNVAQEICEVLEHLGYVCAYSLLNAAFYGVPQTRERMFLIAYHHQLTDSVTFPKPTHWIDLPSGYANSRHVALKLLKNEEKRVKSHNYVCPPESTDGLPTAITAEEAIGDLPTIDARALIKSGVLKRGPRRFDKLTPHDIALPVSDYANLMKSWPGFEGSDGHYDHVIRHLPRDHPFVCANERRRPVSRSTQTRPENA